MERESSRKKFALKRLPLEEYFSPGHRGCQGCGITIAFRHILKAMGPNTVIAEATGCGQVISSPYPQSAWRVPWIHTAFENAAATAAGIEAAYKALMRKGRIAEERINVVALAGDGGTADIGLQALSGALERGHDLVFICYDNEAYMNTGIQRSGLTPFGASTTTSPAGRFSKGQSTWKKDMLAIVAAHRIPYVATASISHIRDLYEKVTKAVEARGPAYLHIFTTCPTGWRCPPDKSVEIARLAVETGVFNLFEIVEGQKRLTYKVSKRRPVDEYLKAQGRFRHLTDEDIAYIQKRLDEEYEELLGQSGGPVGGY
ncbi:MAG: pyruvate synthase subunit beta [Actinobacteria bacterium]|nr:pyruvate synthase subunit beta [Actinomycetota bacterium]